MTQSTEAAARPIATIRTTLSLARCRQPARIERMKQSLSAHGQLTALVAAARPEGVELIDGFKRLAAAATLGWTTLRVRVQPLDETGQWATMLLLNRGPSSMTTLEEALVLREIVKTGLTEGRALARSLHRFETAAKEASRRLCMSRPDNALALLNKVLGMAERAACRLATELGSARTSADASESDESGEMG